MSAGGAFKAGVVDDDNSASPARPAVSRRTARSRTATAGQLAKDASAQPDRGLGEWDSRGILPGLRGANAADGQTSAQRGMFRQPPSPEENGGLMDAIFEGTMREDGTTSTKTADSYLQGLITTTGVRDVCYRLSERMQRLEVDQADIRKRIGIEALENHFVMRSEWEDVVLDKHRSVLEAHAAQLKTLEAAVERNYAAVKLHGTQLERLHSQTEEQAAGLAVARADIARGTALNEQRHNDVLALYAELKAQETEHAALTRDNWQKNQEWQTNEEARFGALAAEVKAQHDFLHSEELLSHIHRSCEAVLKEYVPRREMDGACKAATEVLMEPIQKQFSTIWNDLEFKHRTATTRADDRDKKHDHLLISQGAINAKSNETVSQLWAAIHKLVSKTAMADLDGRLCDRMDTIEEDSKGYKQMFFDKVSEIVERLSEAQTIVEDHEHALQHQADEILNRATKFDLVVCQQRVDLCAAKDKVDSDVKEMLSTIRWQGAKLQDLSAQVSFSIAVAAKNEADAFRSEKGKTIREKSARSHMYGLGESDTPPDRQSNCSEPRRESGDSANSVPMGQYPSPPATASTAATEASPPASRDAARPGRPGQKVWQSPKVADDTFKVVVEGYKPSADDHAKVSGDLGGTSSVVDLAAVGSADEEMGETKPSPRRSPRGKKNEVQAATGKEKEEKVAEKKEEKVSDLQAKGSGQPKQAPNSDNFILLRDQMEFLAQGVLLLGRLALRGAVLGQSREEKKKSEDEMMHHLVSIHFWIANRRAPVDWDANRLTTMVLKFKDDHEENSQKINRLMRSRTQPFSTDDSGPQSGLPAVSFNVGEEEGAGTGESTTRGAPLRRTGAIRSAPLADPNEGGDESSGVDSPGSPSTRVRHQRRTSGDAAHDSARQFRSRETRKRMLLRGSTASGLRDPGADAVAMPALVGTGQSAQTPRRRLP